MGLVIDLFTKEVYKVEPTRHFKDETLHQFSLRFEDNPNMIEAVKEHSGLYCNEIVPYIGNIQLWDKYDSGFCMPIPCNIDNLLDNILASEPWNNLGLSYTLGNAKNNEPFMWMELKYKQTLRILKHCKTNNIHLEINTASDLIAHDRYIDQLDKSWSIYIDLITESPGMPSIKRRQRAFQKLFKLGYNVKPLANAA